MICSTFASFYNKLQDFPEAALAVVLVLTLGLATFNSRGMGDQK